MNTLMAENEHKAQKGVDFGKEEAAMQAQGMVMQLQSLQQQQQALLMQRQQMEVAIAETEAAIEALKVSKDETVFKAIGPVMIRKSKAAVEKELLEGAETAKLRLTTIRKQEDKVKEKMKEISGKIAPLLKQAGIE